MKISHFEIAMKLLIPPNERQYVLLMKVPNVTYEVVFIYIHIHIPPPPQPPAPNLNSTTSQDRAIQGPKTCQKTIKKKKRTVRDFLHG